MTKQIKIEWCRNFILKTFAKYPHGTKIEMNLFFHLAAKAGLYERGTYGSPMSQALAELVTVEPIMNSKDEYEYTVFRLKNP